LQSLAFGTACATRFLNESVPSRESKKRRIAGVRLDYQLPFFNSQFSIGFFGIARKAGFISQIEKMAIAH
jgi:hypothetical protein